MKNKLEQIAGICKDRFDFCIRLIDEFNLKSVAELGVYRGEFAQMILKNNQSVEKYIMIDPWRNLDAWNKPANTDNESFERFYKETIQKTDFAKKKRIVLRGKTTEVINEIPDNTLDFVYIDGDHTLKGISIDLVNIWPKVKEDGFIVGDDFSPSIWQHSLDFEPTLVFPFAVYFAEAINAKIYALPFGQFVMIKQGGAKFDFVDLTNGKYNCVELRTQFFQMKTQERNSINNIVKRSLITCRNVFSAFKKK